MSSPATQARRADRSVELFLKRIARMSAEQRLRASREGRFSHAERALWAAHYPEEVPLVNDEIEWIALGLADLD